MAVGLSRELSWLKSLPSYSLSLLAHQDPHPTNFKKTRGSQLSVAFLFWGSSPSPIPRIHRAFVHAGSSSSRRDEVCCSGGDRCQGRVCARRASEKKSQNSIYPSVPFRPGVKNLTDYQATTRTRRFLLHIDPEEKSLSVSLLRCYANTQIARS